MRLYPQVGFSVARRTIRARRPAGMAGRPGRTGWVVQRRVTLLCLSSSDFGGADHGCVDHGGGQGAVELAGDVALEAAADLAGGLALGGAAGDVGPSPGAVGHAGQGDGVQGAVERAVAAAVEPVAYGAPAAGLEGAGPGQGGERGVVAAAAGVGEADNRLGGANRADAMAVGQPGGQLV